MESFFIIRTIGVLLEIVFIKTFIYYFQEHSQEHYDWRSSGHMLVHYDERGIHVSSYFHSDGLCAGSCCGKCFK